MTGEGDVIENGNIMIEGSKIVAIWADGEIPPINTDNVSTYDTEATIYPGLIDLHNHMHYNHIRFGTSMYTYPIPKNQRKVDTQTDTSGVTIGTTARVSLG